MDQESLEMSEAPPIDTTTTRIPQWLHMDKSALILVSCSLLQLPIWGAAMTFGILQDALAHDDILSGSITATGTIGTTMNGVMYLSMPILAALLNSSRLVRHRRLVATLGTVLASAGFFASSYSTQVWHLILLQGVFAALGSAMLYSPTTLLLAEWFRTRNRATAYAVQLSSKNIVGTVCPFIIYALLSSLGYRGTIRVWAGIVLATGLIGVWMIPKSGATSPARTVPMSWAFLRHHTFYVYAIACMVFSAGYGLPQTYLPTYATDILHLSSIWSVVMIAVFNVPGIISCIGFGMISDKTSLSASSNTLISALGSSLSVFVLWGLKSHRAEALLISFSAIYGFFAGGFSSTWGGWMQDLEREASEHDELVDPSMLYGLMNGARGIGYVVSGLAGIELLKLGSIRDSQSLAYGTKYGAVILFTGISAAIGGWGVLWKCSCYQRPMRPHTH